MPSSFQWTLYHKDGKAALASLLLVNSWGSACQPSGTPEVLVQGEEGDLKKKIAWGWIGNGAKIRETF